MRKPLKRFKRPYIVGVLLLFVLSLVIAKNLPLNVLPPSNNPAFSLRLEMPLSTNKKYMRKVTDDIAREFNKEAYIESITQIVGDTTGGGSQSLLYFQLSENALEKHSLDDIMDNLVKRIDLYKKKNILPNLYPYLYNTNNFGQFNPFLMVIYGESEKNVRKASELFYRQIIDYDGLSSFKWIGMERVNQHQITISKENIDKYGVFPKRVGEELAILVSGGSPTKFLRSNFNIPVRLTHHMLGKESLELLFPRLKVPNMNGAMIPLDKIAKIETESIPNIYSIYNGYPSYSFTADIARKNFDPTIDKSVPYVHSLLKKIQKQVPGIHYELEGNVKIISEMGKRFLMMVAMSLAFMYLLLSVIYRSFKFPLVLVLSIPFGICGAFFSLALFHQEINAFSAIGILVVLGVSAKNGILLIDFSIDALRRGIAPNKAIKQASKERFRPIMMTSLALFIEMIPISLAFSSSSKGEACLGIAILGGLITSTCMSLTVLPILLKPLLRKEFKSLHIKKAS